MRKFKKGCFWFVSAGIALPLLFGVMEHLETADDGPYSPPPRAIDALPDKTNSGPGVGGVPSTLNQGPEPWCQFPGPFQRIGDGPVETESGSNLIPSGLLGDPFVMHDGERFRMWFTAGAVQKDGSFTLGTCYTESGDGIKWSNPMDMNTNQPRYVLKPDLDGWDSVGVEAVSVIRALSGNYHLYYTGDLPPHGSNTFAIGLATSEDGIAWAKHGNGPVLAAENDWEQPTRDAPSPAQLGGVLESSVLLDEKEELFKMWYTGLGRWKTGQFPTFRMGYATSEDGITWQRHKQPVLDKGTPGAWDELWVSHTCVIPDPIAGYHCFYFGSWEYHEGIDQQRGAIGHAYSADGINWERNPNNPVLSPRDGKWDAWSVQGPTAIILDGQIWLWYFGSAKKKESLRAHIGLAKARPPL